MSNIQVLKFFTGVRPYLYYIFFTGYDGLARLLLSKGASVDVISSKGTALHLAASSWKSGIMKILLEHNADVMGYLMFLSAQLLVYKVLLSTTWLTFSF